MSKTFSDITDESKKNNLLIVDGLNLAFRFKYANKKQFAADYINTVKSLANSYNAKHIILLGDGGSRYREEIYPNYKANRKELRAKQTKEEELEFREFLDEFNKIFDLVKNNFFTFRFKGVEADDIAAYIVKYFSNNYNHIWLISSDKDWDLLISKNTSRFSYVTRKEISLNNWSTHYTYPQEEHISIKVLQGDSGDCIPGVEGVGEKRAVSLVEQFGSALDIYASLPINSKYKYIQNLNAFGNNILRNYELMDLLTYCEEALGNENIEIIVGELDGENS